MERSESVHSHRLRPNGTVIEFRRNPLPGGGVVTIYTEITEHKEAEEALKRSQAQLDAIIDNSPALICLKDNEGRYLMVNKRFEDLHGLTKDRVIGKTAHDLFPEAIADAFVTHDQEVIGSNRAVEREQVLDTVEGPRTAIEVKFPIVSVDDFGSIEASVGLVATDITERKEAERAAAAAEAQLRNAIDNMSEGFVVYDADDRLVLCNEQFRGLYPLLADKIVPGVSFEELLAIGVERGQIGGDEKDVARKLAARRAAHRNPAGKPLVHQLSDGRWVQSVERRTGDGGVVGIRTDVTDFIESEEALRASAERLEQREQFLRTVVDTIPAAINIRDTEGRYVLTNQTLADYYGADLKDWIGTIPSIGSAESLVEAAEEAEFQQVITTGVATVDTEYTYGAEGEEEHWLTTRQPIHEDGELRYVLTVANEITERKRAEAALRDSERRYQTITANVPGVVYQKVLHPDGSIGFPYVSEGLRETHGCDPEAVMNEPDVWVDFTHPEDAAGLRQSNLDSIERMEDWNHEYRIVTSDGATKWMRGHSRIRLEPDGDIVWDGVVLDITERKRAEEQVQDLAKFPSENPNPVLRVTPRGEVLYANEVAHSVGRLFAGSRHAKLSGKLVKAVAEVARTGQRDDAEFNAGDRLYSLALTPIGGESYINIYGRDITEERLAQQERQSAETRLANAIENMNEGFALYDAEGHLLVCSRAFRDIYQYSESETMPGVATYDTLGALDQARDNVGDRGQRSFAQRVAELRDGASPPVIVVAGDRIIERRLRLTADGGIVTIQADITERKRAEQELAEKEAQLRLALTHMPGGMVLVDRDQNYVLFNPQYSELYDFPDGLIEVGVSIRDVMRFQADRGDFGSGDRDDLVKQVVAIFRRDEAVSFERDIAGSGRTLQVSLAPTPEGGYVSILTDITERKRGEQALKESEERYALAMEGSHEGLWDWDLRNNEVYISPHIATLLELPVGGLRIRPEQWEAAMHPNDIGAHTDAVRAHLRGETEFFTSEYRTRIENGGYRWVHHRGLGLRGEDGRVYRMAGSLGDITERRQAEEALAEKEAQLRIALDNMPGGFRLVDNDRNYVFFNQQYLDLYDFPEGLLKVGDSNRVENLYSAQRGDFGPGDPDALADQWRDALPVQSEATSWVRETRAGKTLHVRTAPTPDGGVVNIVTDITERKRAEEALAEKEAQLRLALDNMPGGMRLVDRDLKNVLFNARYGELCNYPDDLLKVGGEMDDEVRYQAERGDFGTGDADALIEQVLGRYRRGEATIVERDIPNGPTLQINIAPTPEGGYVSILTDITERKKVERMKNEFVSTVSHELRTPLTSIAGSLDLLIHGVAGEIPEQAMPMIEIAQKNSHRLVRLINDILDIEKIEAGKMAFNYERVGIGQLLDQAVAANQGYVDGLGVGLRLVSKAETASVLGDSDLLMQVMTNLISNAAKFSPEDGAVEIAVSLTDQTVRIAVSDHGPGIPEAFRGRIFEKFAQADSSDTRQRGGTGLGLSICKAIIERHGGEIGFESAPGVGTTFYFELSRWRDAGGLPAAGAALGGPMQLLVCEDDPDVLTLLTMMLEREGFDVAPAANAADAKRLLGEVDVAAMILDLALPDQDGISLIRELREDAATADLPIVVVSAKAKEGKQSLNGDAFGVVDWLEKPIDPKRLFSAIRRALGLVSGHKPRVLHVEDDADVLDVVRAVTGDDAVIVPAGTLSEARRRLRSEVFDLVVLDLMLPDGSGVELLTDLRGPDGAPLPVVIFSVKEVSGDVAARVSATLVKSRTSIDELVATIRKLVTSARGDPGADQS